MSYYVLILCLAAAFKSPDIVGQLQQITQPNYDEFADLISAKSYGQLQPYKEELRSKNQEIKMLKKNQHARRDSLRVSSIPEFKESDDTDAAILSICATIKVGSPVQQEDIAVSHRVKTVAEKNTSGSCEIRHPQYQITSLSGPKNIKTECKENESLKISI